MGIMHQPELDARFKGLWRRRSESLSQAEWEELYRIVVAVLRIAPRLQSRIRDFLKSLPLEAEDYIAEFWLKKVFEPSIRTDTGLHLGTLITAYGNFLSDQHAMAQIRPVNLAESIDDEDEAGSPKLPLPELSTAPIPVEENDEELEIEASAREFFRGLEPWAQLYLCLHQCPAEEDRLPLYRLAKTYKISSYDYCARKLGITGIERHDGRTIATLTVHKKLGYEETLIGQWLTRDLGIDLHADSQDRVLRALEILCRVALSLLPTLTNHGGTSS